MNRTKVIFILIIFAGLGYVLGNFFPFSLLQTTENIQGASILEVKVVTEQGAYLADIEVNVAEEAGPPPIGGTALTDTDGIAVFNIKPGNYYIFFNSSNFPEAFSYPKPQMVEVKEGVLNAKTITLSIK